ncbi:MAG: molybdopterin-dependent oxidoreductase [candidate division KSB1 bacterium]|nr:molybdopterin-dependent oxidoreductase [candidate division KSB1 bacterium]
MEAAEIDLELDAVGPGLRKPLSRRDFLRLGGGILVLFSFPRVVGEGTAQPRTLPDDFNAFLRIAEDGTVSCFTGKIEMGQGVITSLAQMLAEELDVPFDRVKMVMGDTDLCPWDMGTFGSMTTRFFGPPLRKAGAEARQAILELAAERFGLPVDDLSTADGTVFVRRDPTRRLTYGELVQGRRIERRVRTEAHLKRPSEFRIMGRPHGRTDAVAKVTGQAQYAADIRLPGMLYACLLRPPAHGARLLSVDTKGARSVPGAIVIEQDGLVAVLHEKPDMAEEALRRIEARFEIPKATVDHETIFAHLLKVAPEGETLAEGGNLEEGIRLAAHRFSETYWNDYVAHAAIETHAAVAEMKDGKLTVWASTQTPFPLREQIARELDLPPERVRVITPFVGGGFGGKSANQQALEAARLAKLIGRPVQVSWRRQEEFFFDTFRPAAIVKIDAGTTHDGYLCYWDYHVYYAGSRGAEHFYSIPHHRTVAHGRGWQGNPGSHPFATGPWRAPSNNTNTFARESHIDAVAAACGLDPVEFRLRHLKDERMRRLLEVAAKEFGWRSAVHPTGLGLGVACGMDSGTYVVTMAEVSVDPQTGQIRVKRVLAAQDMGICVNPDGARLQMEGCVMMGLGYALTEMINFRGGEILDRNFDTYEIPRFSWLPEIETIIVPNNGIEPQGGGEPAIITMGAVIANAVYDATGARLCRLPMRPERVKAALARLRRE